MTDTLAPRTPAPPALLSCASCGWPHIFTSYDATNLATESAAFWCIGCSKERPRATQEPPADPEAGDPGEPAHPHDALRLIARLGTYLRSLRT